MKENYVIVALCLSFSRKFFFFNVPQKGIKSINNIRKPILQDKTDNIKEKKRKN